MEKKANLSKESSNDSLTPIRPPVEDIIAGASNDDQIKELKENAQKDPIDPKHQAGVAPTAYPGVSNGE